MGNRATFDPQGAREALWSRITRLRAWMASPGFRPRDRRRAMAVAKDLRFEASMQVLRERMVRRDAEEDAAAVAWVKASNSETEAELLETMAASQPRNTGESVHAYVSRLRKLRAEFRLAREGL